MAVEATLPTSATNVTGAIRRAAQLTGTSFQYLLATAQVESSLNAQAKATRSSARGLFQFIEQTWLATLKASGPGLGYGQYADAIEKTPSGRHVVADPDLRREIMALRQDPTANAVMAGAFTQGNAAKLTARLGRAPSDGELYMAHFLGPHGAAKLIGSAAIDPQASAAEMFPQAARANPSIFFDRSGDARSLGQVAQVLAGKYDFARVAPAPAPMSVAATAPAEPFAWAKLASPDSPVAQSRSNAAAAPADTFSARVQAFAPEMARASSSDQAAVVAPSRPARAADSLGHRLLVFASTLAGTMPIAAESADALLPPQPVIAAADAPVRALGFASGSEFPQRSEADATRSAARKAGIRSGLGEARRDRVAPLVSDLWGAPSVEAGLAPPGVAIAPSGRGLQGLFQDAPPNIRALFTRS
jgi:hypothetical protein